MTSNAIAARIAGGREVRPIGKPVTYAGGDAELLAHCGNLVRVRPFYHVPDGRSSLKSARSPYTYEAHVIRASGDDMVVVRMVPFTDSAPWNREQMFKLSELHNVYDCECAACKGDGIHEHHGA